MSETLLLNIDKVFFMILSIAKNRTCDYFDMVI